MIAAVVTRRLMVVVVVVMVVVVVVAVAVAEVVVKAAVAEEAVAEEAVVLPGMGCSNCIVTDVGKRFCTKVWTTPSLLSMFCSVFLLPIHRQSCLRTRHLLFKSLGSYGWMRKVFELGKGPVVTRCLSLFGCQGSSGHG